MMLATLISLLSDPFILCSWFISHSERCCICVE